MENFASWSFQKKLTVLLVFSTVLPLFTVGIMFLHLTSQNLKSLLVKKHQAELNAVSGAVEVFLSGQLGLLNGLSNDPVLQRMDREIIQSRGLRFLMENGFFREILVFDRQGVLRGAAGRHTARKLEGIIGMHWGELPEDIKKALSPSLMRVFKVNGVPQSQIFDLPESKQLALGIPILDFLRQESTIGFLVATAVLDGSYVQKLLDIFPENNEDYLCILNQNGEILAKRGHGLASGAREIRIPEELLRKSVLENKTFSLRVRHLDRIDQVSFVYCKNLQSFVLIGQPWEVAFELVSVMREHFLVMLFFALFISLLGALLLAKNISKPVNDLVEGLRRFKDGVFSYRIPEGGSGDLDEAVRAANLLAESFQKKKLITSIWQEMKTQQEE